MRRPGERSRPSASENPWPVPRSRLERLEEAKRRMDEELAVEHAANERYEHYRATAATAVGRKLSSYNRKTKPYSPPLVPEGKINVTDPDSREMRTRGSRTFRATTRRRS